MISKILLGILICLPWISVVNGQVSKGDALVFNFTSLSGTNLNSKSLQGKVIVLDFWFSGCPPCIDEIPKLNSLVDEFKDKGAVFIAPTWDNELLVQKFLKDHPFKYQVVTSANTFVVEACSDGAGNVVIPTHIIINQDGRIELKFASGLTSENGKKAFEEIRQTLSRLLPATSNKGK